MKKETNWEGLEKRLREILKDVRLSKMSEKEALVRIDNAISAYTGNDNELHLNLPFIEEDEWDKFQQKETSDAI